MILLLALIMSAQGPAAAGEPVNGTIKERGLHHRVVEKKAPVLRSDPELI